MEIVRRNSHFINDISSDNSGIIDPKYRNIVLAHIIGNYSESVQTPLFLAIHGSPGEGKTFQTLQICREHHIKTCYFSGSELSGNYERDSIMEFDEDYKRACNYYAEGEFSVIIVDDFHLSPASTKEGVGTTVNSQLLTGYLMNLCDKAKSSQIDRIPIILLGNTFKYVYDPLKRDGRMNFYQWSAPKSLKKQIVKDLFKDYVSTRDHLHLNQFFDAYQDMPVSFFTELKNDVDTELINGVIERLGEVDIGTYLKAFQEKKAKKKRISIARLYQLADDRKKAALLSSKDGDDII